MSPIDYALTPLRRYADFNGRARRSEYWWYYLLTIILFTVMTLVEGAFGLGGTVGPYGLLTMLLGLALLVPSPAAGVRRLHDTGRSGWWLLIALVPLIGAIVLLIFFVLNGEPGDNAYGPDPKALDNDQAFLR